jgi:uncharacterized lipoprotein
MNISKLLIFSLSLILSLGGCALTTDRIDIQYTQQQGVKTINGANSITVAVVVTDQRPDKSKVSSKKNVFGIEMAPIVANEDVAVTIRRAIEQEVGLRGFQLGNQGAIIQLSADITRFYNDHKNGFFSGDAVAELNLAVIVKSRDGSLLYSRQVNAQGLEANIQLASGKNAGLALNRALEGGMKILFEDQNFVAALLMTKSQSNPKPM